MYGVLLGVHLLVCLGLVGVVLVQSGKGGGLAGGAFGAQAQTVFGGRGANDFITRATIGLGIAFFVTSFALAIITSRGGIGGTHSLIQEQARKAAAGASAQPQRGAAPGGSAVPSAPGGSAVPAPTGTPAPAGGAR